MVLERATETKLLRLNGNKMTMTFWTYLQTALAILLLTAGVANDLRERKVQNQIVLAGLIVGLVFMTATQGLSGLLISVISFLTAIAAVMPLYLMRIFGGGDAKLFLAVSVLLGWQEVLVTLFASIVWGSLLGVFQVLLKGEGKAFAHNILAIANRAKLPEQKTHKIPFTIALLFGYLSNLVWMGAL